MAAIVGEEELSDLDKIYLKFGTSFEEQFLSQGYEENRIIEQTLEIGLADAVRASARGALPHRPDSEEPLNFRLMKNGVEIPPEELPVKKLRGEVRFAITSLISSSVMVLCASGVSGRLEQQFIYPPCAHNVASISFL